MNHTKAIKKAVEKAGGQTALAARIGVSQGLVWQWLEGAAITTKHFSAIQRETGVPVNELLADELAKAASKKAAK